MTIQWLGAASVAALLCVSAPALADNLPDLSKAPRMGPWGFDMSGRDTAVAPSHDFFEYANGTYLKKLEIPADRSRFGAFDALQDLSQQRMRAVTEKAAANTAATGEEAQVGAFYRSYMDEAAVDALGAKPLASDLAAIRKIKTKSEMAEHMGATMRQFGDAFFGAYIHDDAKAPDQYTVYVNQGGLGMPDRDYYLADRFKDQKAAYQAYVAKQLSLAGWDKPEAHAAAIVALETQIAEASWTRAESRDDDKTYNPYAVAELSKYAPGFDWAAYLKGAKLEKVDRVVVSQNTAFPKIAKIFADTPMDTLQAWSAFHLVDQAAPYLSNDFVQASFEFRNKTLSGQPEQRPRWKRAVAATDNNLGDPLGKLYVAAYFPPESKAKMEALVANVKIAMKGRIEKLEWMGPDTKAKALEKLSKFGAKIGYPDKWRDFSGLQIKDGDLYGNVKRASAFDWDYHVARLGGPVDKDEWLMTPATINAYYLSTKNEIAFPAAILQPPFFDPDGDPAVNYGAIGGVIGHEITHGFDDQGRKSDGDGKLTDWWTAEDAAKFDAQAKKFGAQYSAIEVLPGAHINGDLTMGENIADLGGLLVALDAYRLSLNGQPAPVIEGVSGDQRVFLGWAQVWRGKYRDDMLRQQLVSDPHSPPKYRVDVPMKNIDAFYEAFGVKQGDGMYLAPGDRVRIW